MKDLKKLLLILLVFGLLGGGAMTAFILLNQRDETVEIDESEVLANIFKNNSQTVLSPFLTDGSAKRQSLANSEESTDSALGMPAPSTLVYVKLYNYNHISSTSTPGPKASSCKALYVPTEEDSSESYDYFDSEKYYYKWIHYGPNGEILSYNLDKSGENYQYQGGEYAVKILSNLNLYRAVAETSTSNVVSVEESSIDSAGSSEDAVLLSEDTPETTVDGSEENVTTTSEDMGEPALISTDDVSSSYFGDDASVEEVTENGVKYYIATWSYETDCAATYDWKVMSLSRSGVALDEIASAESMEFPSTADIHKIVVKSWSKAENYQIVKQEMYLDSEAAANLISTTTTEVDSREAGFAQVEDDFNFDLSVPVKEIDMRTDYVDPYFDLDAYIVKYSEFLVNNGVQVLVVDDADMYLTFSYQNMDFDKLAAWYSYLIDRDFYAAGADGEQMYNDAVSSYWVKPGSNPLMSVDYSNSDYTKSISVSIFGSGVTEDDIWNNYIYKSSDMKSLMKTISVDGASQSVTAYYWDYSDVVYEGSSSGYGSTETDDTTIPEKEFEEDYKYASFYVLVSKGNFKYLVTYNQSGVEAAEVVLPNFKILDMTNSSLRDSFVFEVKAAWENSKKGIEPMPAADVETKEVEE